MAMNKSGRPIFYCEMCPELMFDGKMNLTKHMHRCHIPEKRKCEICHRIPRKGWLRHMNRCHTAQHKCNLCGAAYKYAHGLTNHMHNHDGVKPYLCANCGKSFVSPDLLRRHEATMHSNVRKYPCAQCDRAFHRRYILRDHINAYHTMSRPHICDRCGKGFTSSSYLRVHKFTHGEKSLKCRYCDHMFKLSENRYKHEVSIHKIAKKKTTKNK